MADYGHELEFGSFLTPGTRDPGGVVDLAVLSEEVGLDLVTFQDHPYNPGLLDTWTLLSWVAARTRRIRVGSNVTGVPLRNPAVLARTATSLDLLSGGRLGLGLGAGAFWEAISAMGVPALTPGQRVTALGEAIDIIRGIWDADERGPLRVAGEFHSVDGAKRGPAPAHDIPIWLGAYKPRLLRMVGAKADGWLPSLSYLGSPTVSESNALIDEGAERVGRDPREIRRLLNVTGAFGPSTGQLQGPPEQWVEELLPFVLDDGFSTFVLGSDDPRALSVFGREVAPALREAVAAERASTGTAVTGRIRPAAALALRHEGIDYDAVPDSLAERAVEPGDRAYEDVRSTYLWRGAPGLVLRPSTADQVADAVRYARIRSVPLSVRSGGHGISSRSTNDGGIVIGLGALDQVTLLDRERRLVRVGAGARWGEVAAKLAPHGLAISSGDSGGVGAGGLATTGGIGFLARSYGLTIDHVKAVEVVLADGRRVTADAAHEPDLFWALRGAGANMGVVTSFDIEATELADVVLAVFTHDASDLAGFLGAWGARVEASPRELTPFLTVVRQRGQVIGQTYALWAGDDTEAAVAALEPFLGIAPVLQQQARLVPYSGVVAPGRNVHRGEGGYRMRSALVDHLDEGVTRTVAGMFEDGGTGYFQIRSVGGAVNDTPADATAYAHRSQNFALSAMLRGSPGGPADDAWDALGATGLYLSFETHEHATALTRAYPPATLDRLRRIKHAYDPDNVFHANFPVLPT
ncbi:LLM class flavin-dependent oxidoreductase [Streptomyces sp. NPDC005955]|uniref:LLM class flavin-dependent oxidoreductase n=1 Tax=Streptomyces sp. NPDC005955 TaxID=3364738 RepID=UPI0036ABA3D3